MKQVYASVISNREVVPSVYLIWLESPQITAQPGQFVMVRCGEGLLLRRPLSIHQLVDRKVAFLFTVVGKGTYWLSQRKVGDNLDLLGPLGSSYSIHPASHNLLLVAGGIGIAPLCFLAQVALNQGYSVTLLLGASTATQLYPGHFLPHDVELIIATEDGTMGKKGMITDFLPNFVGWADQIFACGPTLMYHTMANQQPLKTKSVQISLGVRMGCGRGICYGCTLKTKSGLKQVCKDGPIFDLADILWDELFPLSGRLRG
ncbi:dihydroorotate dehydrogenase electron transfer subunit, partial [Dehalococcoidales bacterium]|nr:dihydroorotate dehydrogenase electron transfer subunit [Dehalococcoidales bacterium]